MDLDIFLMLDGRWMKISVSIDKASDTSFPVQREGGMNLFESQDVWTVAKVSPAVLGALRGNELKSLKHSTRDSPSTGATSKKVFLSLSKNSKKNKILWASPLPRETKEVMTEKVSCIFTRSKEIFLIVCKLHREARVVTGGFIFISRKWWMFTRTGSRRMNMKNSVWRWAWTSPPVFRGAQQTMAAEDCLNTGIVEFQQFNYNVHSKGFITIYNNMKMILFKRVKFCLLVSLPVVYRNPQTTTHHWLRQGVEQSKEIMCAACDRRGTRGLSP